MNWNNVTVKQYQQIVPLIMQDDLTDLDRLVKIICVLTGKSETEVDSMPLSELNGYRFIYDLNFEKKVLKRFKANGRYYRLVWKVDQMPAARYIESKTFATDFIQNLHKVMASAVMPQRKILFWYFDRKYNAAKHEQYAADLQAAPFPFVYNACVFFCALFRELMTVSLSCSLEEAKMNPETIKALKESLTDILDGSTTQP